MLLLDPPRPEASKYHEPTNLVGCCWYMWGGYKVEYLSGLCVCEWVRGGGAVKPGREQYDYAARETRRQEMDSGFLPPSIYSHCRIDNKQVQYLSELNPDHIDTMKGKRRMLKKMMPSHPHPIIHPSSIIIHPSVHAQFANWVWRFKQKAHSIRPFINPNKTGQSIS